MATMRGPSVELAVPQARLGNCRRLTGDRTLCTLSPRELAWRGAALPSSVRRSGAAGGTVAPLQRLPITLAAPVRSALRLCLAAIFPGGHQLSFPAPQV